MFSGTKKFNAGIRKNQISKADNNIKVNGTTNGQADKIPPVLSAGSISRLNF